MATISDLETTILDSLDYAIANRSGHTDKTNVYYTNILGQYVSGRLSVQEVSNDVKREAVGYIRRTRRGISETRYDLLNLIGLILLIADGSEASYMGLFGAGCIGTAMLLYSMTDREKERLGLYASEIDNIGMERWNQAITNATDRIKGRLEQLAS